MAKSYFSPATFDAANLHFLASVYSDVCRRFIEGLRHGLKLALAAITILSAGVIPIHAQVNLEAGLGKAEPHHISLSGRIDIYTLYSFVRLMSDPRISVGTQPIIKLDSVGGSVTAAMAIGHHVRDRGFKTAVEKGKDCLSACVLILAAGIDRVVSSGKVGVHRPRHGVAVAAPSPDAQTRANAPLLDDMRRYLHAMGMGEGLFAAMVAVPPESMKMLRRDEMHAVGLVADGRATALVAASTPVAGKGRARAAGVRKQAFARSNGSKSGQRVATGRGKSSNPAARKVRRGAKSARLIGRRGIELSARRARLEHRFLAAMLGVTSKV